MAIDVEPELNLSLELNNITTPNSNIETIVRICHLDGNEKLKDI